MSSSYPLHLSLAPMIKIWLRNRCLHFLFHQHFKGHVWMSTVWDTEYKQRYIGPAPGGGRPMKWKGVPPGAGPQALLKKDSESDKKMVLWVSTLGFLSVSEWVSEWVSLSLFLAATVTYHRSKDQNLNCRLSLVRPMGFQPVGTVFDSLSGLSSYLLCFKNLFQQDFLVVPTAGTRVRTSAISQTTVWFWSPVTLVKLDLKWRGRWGPSSNF